MIGTSCIARINRSGNDLNPRNSRGSRERAQASTFAYGSKRHAFARKQRVTFAASRCFPSEFQTVSKQFLCPRYINHTSRFCIHTASDQSVSNSHGRICFFLNRTNWTSADSQSRSLRVDTNPGTEPALMLPSEQTKREIPRADTGGPRGAVITAVSSRIHQLSMTRRHESAAPGHSA